MSLYSILPDFVSNSVKNNKTWKYGYDSKYDIVIISKDGTLGDVYEINGLKIGLPSIPKSKLRKDVNKWKPKEYPQELSKIKNIFEWNSKPNEFKVKWVDYIREEFENRESGHWFINKKTPTYITGSHYMYLQWSKIDIGLPDFRESNRIFFIFWEACKADDRAFGMCYLKNRRSGFSFMSSSETANIGTLARDSKLGILSKTGSDAKEMFTNKVVPIVKNYPFFFKPIQDGMDNPKTELSFRMPAKKITRKNISDTDQDEIIGLDTTIDWLNTADNSYDGQKLLNLVHDECYAPSTKIMMSDWSFKEIKDINIGDKVMISGGIVRTVVKKTEGNTDMYTVKQKWGEDYIVSKNHRLVFEQYIYNGRNKSKKRVEKIMTPEEYISLSKYKKQHTFSVKSKPIQSKDSDMITIHPYLLGLWLGDGRKNEFTIIVNKEKDPELLVYLGNMAQIFNIPFEIKKSTSESAVYFKFYFLNTFLNFCHMANFNKFFF